MNISIIIPVNDVMKDGQNISEILYRIKPYNLELEIIFVISNLNHNLHERKLIQILESHPTISLHTKILKSIQDPGTARNIGIENSKNEWLMFWDSDDLPHWENLIHLLDSKDFSIYDLIIGQFVSKSYNSILFRNTSDFKIRDVAMNPGIWRMMFRKSLLSKEIFPSSRLGEDQFFFAKIISKNPKIYFSKNVIYKHNFNFPNRLSTNSDNFQDLFKLLTERYDEIFRQKSNLFAIRIIFTNQIITGLYKSKMKKAFLILFIKSILKNRISLYSIFSKARKLYSK